MNRTPPSLLEYYCPARVVYFSMAIRFSIIAWLASVLLSKQVTCRPPSSTWISHINTFGDGCPSAKVTLAADASSFTIEYDLKSLGHPLAAMGPGVSSRDRTRDCSIYFMLQMPEEETNRSIILAESERSGEASLGEGVTATVYSQMTGRGMPAAYIPRKISIVGQMSGAFSQRLPAYIDPLGREALVGQWGTVKLPGRDGIDVPLACPNSRYTGHSIYDPTVWGNQIALLETFEVSGPDGAAGSLGIGDTYSHTVYLKWLDPCPATSWSY